jgi:hypothetical protein
MVTTSTDHLVFGHGRHACPGRYVLFFLPLPVQTVTFLF